MYAHPTFNFNTSAHPHPHNAQSARMVACAMYCHTRPFKPPPQPPQLPTHQSHTIWHDHRRHVATLGLLWVVACLDLQLSIMLHPTASCSYRPSTRPCHTRPRAPKHRLCTKMAPNLHPVSSYSPRWRRVTNVMQINNRSAHQAALSAGGTHPSVSCGQGARSPGHSSDTAGEANVPTRTNCILVSQIHTCLFPPPPSRAPCRQHFENALSLPPSPDHHQTRFQRPFRHTRFVVVHPTPIQPGQHRIPPTPTQHLPPGPPLGMSSRHVCHNEATWCMKACPCFVHPKLCLHPNEYITRRLHGSC